VRWLDPAAAWAAQIGASPTGTTFAAAIVATVDMLFDDTKADLRHTEQFECVLHPLADPPDIASLVAVDHDPRDLRSEPPPGATYLLTDARIGSKTLFRNIAKELTEHLMANRTVSLLANPELKLYSRPGETAEEFAGRCQVAADEGADAATAKVAKRYEARVARARQAVAAAEDRVSQAEAAAATRANDELLSGVGDLLGSILGGRGSARSIARGMGTAARRRGRSGEAAQRVETASNRVEEKLQALADLEADMADELAAIVDEWDAKETAVEPLEVPLEKSDIRVADLSLVWIPVA
jgi:hypothetical protein